VRPGGPPHPLCQREFYPGEGERGPGAGESGSTSIVAFVKVLGDLPFFCTGFSQAIAKPV
jgi:hypothetical protein